MFHCSMIVTKSNPNNNFYHGHVPPQTWFKFFLKVSAKSQVSLLPEVSISSLYKIIFHPQKFSLFRKARSGSGRIRNFNLLNKFWRKISSLLYNLKQYVPIVPSSHIKSMKIWGNLKFPLPHGNWRPIHIHILIHHSQTLSARVSCHHTTAKTDLLRFIKWFASEENNWSFKIVMVIGNIYCINI